MFWSVGVILSAVGLYGVIAYSVVARTREIGIRMAIGADRARVLRQVIGESASLALTGIALGLLSAWWASRSIGSLLYGLSATDPWTYSGLAFALVTIAFSAAWIPAKSAAQVDPMVALRYE
jgi:putative ABC transport system permease protein